MSLELALALNRIERQRILVVGDYIHDREIHCETVRFAQEAPHCPVWKEGWNYHRPGGAGAVDAMVFALGAASTLICAPEPYAAAKTRYFVNGVQTLRIDTDAHPDVDSARIAAHVADEAQRADCVLIADYSKGVCTNVVIRAAIDGAKARGIPCIADPHEKRAWKQFDGATAIKCNENQWGNAIPTGTWPWNSRLVVTAGAKGCLFSENGRCTSDAIDIPARQRRMVDVTGAGDCFLSALGICISSGMSWPDACKIANAAAGLKVERRGAVSVPRCEVVADLLTGIKIISPELIASVCAAASNHATKPQESNGIIWTNGCFDGGLHAGHLHLLEEAKKLGDMLIVGVNFDDSVRQLKGPGRPLRTCIDRCKQVAALACVDYVVAVKNQEHLRECIDIAAPELLCVGSDYRGKEVVGSEHVGRVHFIERLPGHSTTECVRRLASCERA